VLNDSPTGWFSSSALDKLASAANVDGTAHSFSELFDCDPHAPHYGFRLWDAFFTRRFRENIRPVASADDESIIANPCESKPSNLARSVQVRDTFWIKGSSYSLADMLGERDAETFVIGTVYQAYLDTYSYHRWNAPVSGRIVKTFTLDGTYFSTPRAI
jgi:phosphatidylserine decarboxylase